MTPRITGPGACAWLLPAGGGVLSTHPTTLALDVGGTGLKSLLLDAGGKPQGMPGYVLTPRPATPDAVVDALVGLAEGHVPFDRISCGFPGVVVEGVVYSAPNLDGDWSHVPLAARLTQRLGRPCRIANDADVQGYGAIAGRGVELTLTLGTGVGAGLFIDGILVPNLELGHHPFADGRTYEELLGKDEVDRTGPEVFNARLREALATLQRVFNPRRIYVGGGNANKIVGALPEGVEVVDNAAGLWGGIALWRDGSKRNPGVV